MEDPTDIGALTVSKSFLVWFDSSGNSRARRKPGRLSQVTKYRSLRNRRKQSHGFTVLELLIVVAIVLTISAIAVPNLMAAIDQARIARAVGDFTQ